MILDMLAHFGQRATLGACVYYIIVLLLSLTQPIEWVPDRSM
jgi:hypothetical protein